jgi:hypothetical protein
LPCCEDENGTQNKHCEPESAVLGVTCRFLPTEARQGTFCARNCPVGLLCHEDSCSGKRTGSQARQRDAIRYTPWPWDTIPIARTQLGYVPRLNLCNLRNLRIVFSSAPVRPAPTGLTPKLPFL